MRILLANTGYPDTIKGGAEAAVLDLARKLAARGHSVALVTHHGGKTLETFQEDGIRFYALPNRNLYFGFDGKKRAALLRAGWHLLDSANPFMAKAFGRVLDEERPDVVNTHVVAGLSQLIWRETKKRKLRLVHYLHEYGSLCPRGSGFRDGRLCLKPCSSCRFMTAPRRTLSHRVDAVIGVSRYTLQRHLDWGFFPDAETAVLPNIFADIAFRGRSRPESGLLRLGYFGRLIPDKGAHLLIEAVKTLPSEGWTLDIAGTGDEAYIASLKAAAPPPVRFLGWTKSEDFFKTIDLMILPSLWPDPQPRVTFEAFMHGVPVIGAKAGGIPEEIDEGLTGWLFDAGSVNDLAALLQLRLKDRADLTLPEKNFSVRLEELDPEKVIQDYERIYSLSL